MKKLLYVLGIVLGFSSCTYTEVEYKSTNDGRKVQIMDIPHNIKYIEFDDHEYVYYHTIYKGSICHSPKCKCLNEYKK